MITDTVARAAAARAAWAARRRTRSQRYAISLAAFCAVTVFWFWPLVTHVNTHILYGATDAAGSIRAYWATAQQGKTPFTTSHDPLMGAPEGVPAPSAVAIAQPIQNAAIWLLKDIVGFTSAFNLFVLAGFVLTGFAAFVLLDRLGLHPLASFFGAYVIAFNPWSFARALAGHAAFVHGWVLIVLAGTLLSLARKPTARSAVIAGLAYGLTFQMAAYWGLLATLMVVAFYVVQLLRGRSWTDRLWLCTLACSTGAVLLLTLTPALIAYHTERAAIQGSIGHPTSQLRQFAATIPSYLVPNTRHPVLGWLGHPFTTSKNAYSERSVFFGWTTIALAAFVVGLRIRRPRTFDRAGLRFAVLLFAVIAPAACIASLAPQLDVAGLNIPMPSWFVSRVTTYYRVYARFGFLFGFAISVLAAVAVDLLRRRRHGLAWTSMLFAATIFQLLPGSITTWEAAQPPAWDVWLAHASPGIVAHYPLLSDDPPSQTMGFEEQYFQRFAHHPLYNMTLSAGSLVSREGAVRLLSRDLADPTTPTILSAEHVRYVVVHEDVYRQEGSRIPVLGNAFKQVARFGAVRICVVRAAPANLNQLVQQNSQLIAQLQNFHPGTVNLGSGFYAGEKYSYSAGAPAAGLWHWMQQDGELIVQVPEQEGVTYTLSGQGFSATTPRSLDVITKSGKILAHADVPPNLVDLSLGPLALSPGTHRLYLYADPAPAPLGGADTRVASVFLSPLQLSPLPNLTDLNTGS